MNIDDNSHHAQVFPLFPEFWLNYCSFIHGTLSSVLPVREYVQMKIENGKNFHDRSCTVPGCCAYRSPRKRIYRYLVLVGLRLVYDTWSLLTMNMTGTPHRAVVKKNRHSSSNKIVFLFFCMILLAGRSFNLFWRTNNHRFAAFAMSLDKTNTCSSTSTTCLASTSSSSSSAAVDPIQQYPIGLGTFLLGRDQVRSALRSAILQAGYRRIDCAPVYFNEDVIGDTLQEILQEENTAIRREDLYIVSKLPSPFHTNPKAAVLKTLSDLRLEYLDLYLIHWPVAFKPVAIPDASIRGWENEDIDDSDGGNNIDLNVSIHDTWRAMEELGRCGFGPSNWCPEFPRHAVA